MTHFVAQVSAYDALGTVVVSAVCVDHDAQGHAAEEQFSCVTTVPGTGESDHREWLRDALIAILERL